MNQAAESTEMFLTALIFESSSELCLSHLFRFWCVCCVCQGSWEEKRNHCCGESCWLRADRPGGADAKFGVQPCNRAGGLDLWEMDLRPIQSGYEPESQEELKTGAITLLLFCVLPANHGLPSAPQAVTMESCVNGDWQTGWGIIWCHFGLADFGGLFSRPVELFCLDLYPGHPWRREMGLGGGSVVHSKTRDVERQHRLSAASDPGRGRGHQAHSRAPAVGRSIPHRLSASCPPSLLSFHSGSTFPFCWFVSWSTPC